MRFPGGVIFILLAVTSASCTGWGRLNTLAPDTPGRSTQLPLAPEIEGEDLDGQEFKLSDYRGQVVLLDFWGNW